MRLFNREVFRGTVYATEQFTPQEFNGLLGSADALALHLVSNRVTTGGAQIVINIYHSGDNQNWVLYGSLLATQVLAAGQQQVEYVSEVLTGTLARGAFVRLGITLNTTGDSDLVVIATGRAI